MFEKMDKWLNRSDEDFFKEFSSLPRRKLELERLRLQRVNYLNWMIASIFIVGYGILFNIVGHGNTELSFWANVQQNMQPQNFFATFPPLVYFYLCFSVAFVIRYIYTDSKIKMLLLFDKTQSKE